ncbi:peptidase M24, structural domain-containing protein [Tribonema minus]|uniref:Methionine aminopeptidase n=1 Tax=Tribonema minus TaxID=303371 RepID=A0A835ZL51_9STRA|nr:peptidase M24, structural domain-containing protein [Tribonema minus]
MAELCETPGCGKPASMGCPTCIKLGLPRSLYCSQECFKSHWPQHKALHKLVRSAQEPSGILPAFSGYSYTGSLRPAPLSAPRVVPSHIPRPDYADHPLGHSASEQGDKMTNTSIPIYTAKQVEGIREACRIGREVLDAGGRAARVGATTDEIDRVVHEACVERGAYPSPLNYYQFPKSVCTSVNEAICHGIPDARELSDGDVCNVDVSTYFGGFHGDLNETFLVGGVDDEGRALVKTAFTCLQAAINMVRPGTMYRDLGTVIGKVARENNCQVVRTYCGHGIGALFHTVPNIPHYPKNKAKGIMKPGHIFTIEPMINLGVWQDRTWPDNWTSVTADGRRSAQFEHTILVTDTGYELLTARENEPVMTWNEALLQR